VLKFTQRTGALEFTNAPPKKIRHGVSVHPVNFQGAPSAVRDERLECTVQKKKFKNSGNLTEF
jgi:hypothetical protein